MNFNYYVLICLLGHNLFLKCESCALLTKYLIAENSLPSDHYLAVITLFSYYLERVMFEAD